MFNMLKKLDDIFCCVNHWIIIFTSFSITALILFGIVTRYVLDMSVIGILELSTLLAVWLYMSGAIVASRNGQHLIVDFLSLKIHSPKVKAIYNMAVSVIVIIATIFFIILAQDMILWFLKRPQSTPGLDIPLIVPQSAIVLAAISTCIYGVRNLVVAWLDFSKYSTFKDVNE